MMAAPRMARRETPVKRYSFDPLVKVTRTVPVIGLPMTLRAALLNFESMGSIGLVVWYALVYRVGGHRCPLVDSLEIGHHSADLQTIDLRIIPAAAVWGLLRSTIPQQTHQLLVVVTAASGIVERLIVANPEGDIPGLPVCPSVESVAHCLSFVWYALV